MSDLELTKLCAEAMGYPIHQFEKRLWILSGSEAIADKEYLPLHDDAQAMALVKRFCLWLETDSDGHWIQTNTFMPQTESLDLNRAICECVAKMQQAKQEADKRFGQPHFGHSE